MEISNIIEQFRGNIIYIRHEHNLTQKEMAAIMGVGVGTIRKIEKGETMSRINCRMLCRVCDHFDLSVDAILKCDFETQ